MRELDGIEVAHGDHCVLLARQEGPRRFAAVLTPDEARTIAERLIQQADYAEESR